MADTIIHTLTVPSVLGKTISGFKNKLCDLVCYGNYMIKMSENF